MSGVENTEQVEQEQIGTAAFAAGYEDDEDAVEPTETPAPAPETDSPAAEPAAAPEFVQITKDEWSATQARAAKVDEIEATWTKRMDQAFGKMGGLERKFAELQSGTPNGQAVQVDESDFEDMVREYPELAAQQIKGLNKALGKLRGTGGGIDQATVQRQIAEATDALRVDLTLDQILPQWKKQVNTPEFNGWLSSNKGWDTRLTDKAFVSANLADANSPLAQWVKANPAEPVALYLSSDVDEAAKMLRLYKDRTAKAPVPPAANKAATPAQPSVRQRQIAAAVPPKNEGSAPPSKGKTPFMAGYEDED